MRLGFFPFTKQLTDLCFHFRSFVINGEVYELGDFATVDITNTESVCRILCLYESNEKWHQKAKFRAIVRWYPFAKNLKKYFSEQMIDSGDTEVRCVHYLFFIQFLNVTSLGC